jgi:hypothetical protein
MTGDSVIMAKSSRPHFLMLAIDIALISVAAIVLLVVEVPVNTFFVLLLFGFCLSGITSVLMVVAVRMLTRESSWQSRGSALTSAVLVTPLIAVVVLTVKAVADLPTSPSGAEIVLILAMSLVTILSLGWFGAMFAKSVSEHAWTVKRSP